MPVIRRLFGIVDDATPGGQDYDTLVLGSPTIPDASTFYPVTGGNFDGGIERIDRNAEVRGYRANTAPLPFRGAPSMTIPVAAYRSVIEKVIYKAMGDVNTTGAGPYTHTLTSIPFGSINLPAMHCQMIRDDLNIKMGGSVVNRVTLNFPLDGEGTAEFEAWGKWASDYDTAAPTVSFADLSANPFMLRDARAYINDSVTQIQDLQGLTFGFVNNLTRKWYAGRNVEERVLSAPSGTNCRKLWWPSENKAQGAPDITYSIQFGNTVVEQEIRQWFSQVQKLEFIFDGDTCQTGVPESMTITIFNGVNTGGGAEPLTARDDIPATFEGGAFYSLADASDVEIVIVSDTAVLA